MFIKSIVIEGVQGNVEIAHTDAGALVTEEYFTTGRFGAKRKTRVLCEVARDEPREARFAKAVEAAKAICGTCRDGSANATNSMIHDVLNEIERVAGR